MPTNAGSRQQAQEEVLNADSDPRGYAVYFNLSSGFYKSF